MANTLVITVSHPGLVEKIVTGFVKLINIKRSRENINTVIARLFSLFRN